MSRKPAAGSSDDAWLDPEQQRVWLAWMRISLRLDYELNRELQEDGGLSHPDYHVLVALGGAAGGRLQLSDLANTIGWERSRLSHHLQRMTTRGLTRRVPSATDGRATDAVITPAGRRALAAVAPHHAAFVRDLFFGDLDGRDLPTLAGLLERVYDGVLARGTLPPPPAADGPSVAR
ncbi:MarR family winged helix-turn-helix transcriptional regulator [Jatrophihabitans sp. YIM 134969]